MLKPPIDTRAVTGVMIDGTWIKIKQGTLEIDDENDRMEFESHTSLIRARASDVKAFQLMKPKGPDNG